MDAHANPREGDRGKYHVDFVACTSGIGLWRKTSGGHFQSRKDVELKPKVILTQAMERLTVFH